MTKRLILGAALAGLLLLAPGAGTAGERTLTELRTEFMALTDSITAQARLLEIYEDLGKSREEEEARSRLLELIGSHRKLLDELEAALGVKPAEAPPPAWPVRPVPPRPVAPRGVLPGKGEVARAIALGLEWLANHQDPGGFWDCDGFMKMDKITPICDGAGNPLYDPGVSGLALLAFLGAGETHKTGRYKEAVKNGLKYLKQIQDPEGCFGPRTTSHFTYNHMIAALAMCEAYGRTRSPLFKESAQRGIDFIHKAQNPNLGWRYGVRPQDNDTSVTGWAIAALAAGRRAELRVDRGGFDGGRTWIDKVTEPEFGRVGYTSRGTGPARPQALMNEFPADKSESLTAEGILVRIETGEDPRTSEPIQKGAELVLKNLPAWDRPSGTIDMYYWLWGTMAMKRIGDRPWGTWSKPMRKVALESQRGGGSAFGSWDPVGVWGLEGGRVYSTALMLLTLEAIREK